VPCVRRFVSEVQPKRPGFDLRPIRVRIVVDKMTLEHVSLRLFRFSTDSIFHPLLQLQLILTTLSEGQTGEAWEPGSFGSGNRWAL
jgi:hypothetical protein